MKKKLVSAFLALCMALAMLPGTVLAVGEDTAELPPLSDPTDLTWSAESRGTSTWTIGETFQGQYKYKIYKVGNDTPVYQTTVHGVGTLETASHRFFALYCAGDGDAWESGDYYFTVQNIGDGIQYSDSAVISSESLPGGTYSYVKPEGVLDTPTQGTWEWPAAMWDDNQAEDPQIRTYLIDYGFSESKIDDPAANPDALRNIGGSSRAQSGVPDNWLQEKLIGEHGAGYYYFRIRALSSDIEDIQNSAFSPWSEGYNLLEASAGITSELEKLASDENTQDIKQAVQNLNTVELKNAMVADLSIHENGSVSALAALEEKVGGPAEVSVASEMSNTFSKDDISVVGAALNNKSNESNGITLNVGRAKDSHDIRDELYDSTVAVDFSMDLDNVANTSQLQVPVKITLPIPATINPDFLVILHYHQDGSFEKVLTNCYQDNGKWFVSFVLTSFSDFVMLQTRDAEVPPVTGDEYAITIDSADHGTVTAPAKAAAGATVTITVTPEEGYQGGAPTVTDAGGSSVAVTDIGSGKYTFVMPAGAATITPAAFTAIDYTVTVSDTTHGTVAVSPATAHKGDTVTITVTPDACFKANAPVVTGISGDVTVTKASDTTYTFTMPAENVSIAVSFESTLQLTYTPYSSLNADDKKLYYGGKLEITGLVADAQYLVTFDNGLAAPTKVNGKDVIPRIGHVVTADGSGKVILGCQESMNVIVFGVDGTDVNTDLVELYAKDHAGVPVTSFVSADGP